MQAATLRTAALAIVPAVITTVLIQACGGSSDAVAQSPTPPAADAAEGLWDQVVTFRDCVSGAALSTVRGMYSLQRGGTVSDVALASGAVRSPGLGVWRRTGDSTATVTYRFFRINADGTPAGSTTVTRNLTFAADNNSSTSNNTAVLRDLTGTTVGNACATDTATRLFGS